MPGVRSMMTGVLVASIGLVVTGGTYALAADGGYYVVAYGAIFVGGIQFLGGTGRLLAYQLRSPKKRKELRAHAAWKGIVQAMAATCVADGTISEDEVAAITTIYRDIFGHELSEAAVRGAAEQVVESGFDIGEALRDTYRLIEPELRPVILRAAYLVAAADGTLDSAEAVVLVDIGSSLRMSEEEIKSALAEIAA